MRVLFVHNDCPGQFKHLAAALADDPANRVVFVAREFWERPPAVECRAWDYEASDAGAGHPYLVPVELAVRAGRAAYEVCCQLKREGFVPDVICAHAGFGPGMYLKEVFPDTPLLGYFEWLYRGAGTDCEYLDGPMSPDMACRARTRNAAILLELASCDAAVTPTGFQRDQFPAPLREKLQVLHDGIDTDFYSPAAAGPSNDLLPALPADTQVLTYATRGMEPMRGFPQFAEAAAALLEARPQLHVLLAGEDRVAYSNRLANGNTYKQQALADFPLLDCERVHFLGKLPAAAYRDLLCMSTVHVYLTAPFVLSWSCLEAMACECLLVGADTQPVVEVMRDEREGLLVDFRQPARLRERIAQALDHQDTYAPLRRAARRRVLDNYRLARQLPRQVALLESLASASRDASGWQDTITIDDRLQHSPQCFVQFSQQRFPHEEQESSLLTARLQVDEESGPLGARHLAV